MHFNKLTFKSVTYEVLWWLKCYICMQNYYVFQNQSLTFLIFFISESSSLGAVVGFDWIFSLSLSIAAICNKRAIKMAVNTSFAKKFLPSLFPSMLTKWLSQAKSVPAQCGTNTRPIKALGCHSGWFPMIRLHKLSNYYMALQFNRDTLGTQKRWELASTVWRWVLHLLDAGWKSLLCCGPRMRRTQYIWGHAYSAHHFIQPAPFAL